MMDLKIKTFLTIADVKSFTKAADILCLTQPAVSHQIKLLEEEFGIKIFNKTGSELKLSEQGEILLKYSRKVAAINEIAHQALADSRKNLRCIFIGMTPTAEENMIPEVLGNYCLQNKATKIRIVTGTIEEIKQKLLDYSIDLAIIGNPPWDKNLESVLLDQDHLCLIASPENPITRNKEISLSDLRNENLILRSPSASTRQVFEAFLRSNQESISNFHIMMELDNVTTIKDLVMRNLGVSIISNSACIAEQAKGKLVAIKLSGKTEMSRSLCIVFLKTFSHPEAVEEIRNIYNKMKDEEKSEGSGFSE